MLCMGASKATLSRLQKLQNRALRICYIVNRYTSNYELHSNAGTLPVALRRKLDLYKLMYKRALLDANTQIVPESSQNERPNTRYASARPLTFVKPKSSRFLESVTYQGPKLWADLPNNVKNLNDAGTFDKEIRMILHNEFLNNNSV